MKERHLQVLATLDARRDQPDEGWTLAAHIASYLGRSSRQVGKILQVLEQGALVESKQNGIGTPKRWRTTEVGRTEAAKWLSSLT